MFLTTGIAIHNLDHFAKFEVGPISKNGIYPVRAYYPNSERYETLYANTNIDHCWEYLHKLEHLTNAQEIDMHSVCECDEEPDVDDSVDYTILEEERLNAWAEERDRLEAQGCGDAPEVAWERINQ